MKTIDITVPGAREKFEKWIKERGGVRVWNNVNLSNPNAGQVFTPALDEACRNQSGKPHWSRKAGEIVTDINRFRFVDRMLEVDRIRIRLRMGAQGLQIKLTDASTRNLNRALDRAEKKYGKPAYYRWGGHDGRDAVIEIPIWEKEVTDD